MPVILGLFGLGGSELFICVLLSALILFIFKAAIDFIFFIFKAVRKARCKSSNPE